ncbi:MAG: acyl carrier protein [Bacteroidales bacterium]|nr:acyl carrier protein [Bacteroidales bacterium]
MKEILENTAQIKEKIDSYIRKNTLSNISNLNDKTLLFREGIFDSMAFVLLIDYIEETFGIKASDEDLIEENFESIEAITRFITHKYEVSTVR